MVVNELTSYELERIIRPVLQMRSMSVVCSEIGKVIGIPKADRQKIQKQDKFTLRYKNFEMFFYDLKWLRGRGACMSLQFIRPATKWQKRLNTWFGESNKRMDKVCGEVVRDLESITRKEMPDIKLASTDVTASSAFDAEETRFRVFYPEGAFNDRWKEGRDVAPLMISDDYNLNGDNWFISWSFNAGAFVRNEGTTVLRENWREYANDLSTATEAWVTRNCPPSGSPVRRKTFEEWSEDMILDFGDEIIPELPSLWKEIQSK